MLILISLCIYISANRITQPDPSPPPTFLIQYGSDLTFSAVNCRYLASLIHPTPPSPSSSPSSIHPFPSCAVSADCWPRCSAAGWGRRHALRARCPITWSRQARGNNARMQQWQAAARTLNLFILTAKLIQFFFEKEVSPALFKANMHHSFHKKKHAAQLSVILFNRVHCWSAAAAMSRQQAERSRDVREQRNREMRYLVPLK
jgi:hypothetical protein